MKSKMVWRCNECGKEVIPEEHYKLFPRHSYFKTMRFSKIQSAATGNEFVSHYAEVFTTLTNYKTVLSMDKGPNLMPGTYRIDWSCEIYQDVDDEKTSARLYDGSEVLMETDTAGVSGNWISVAGFKYIKLNNQNKKYQLQLKTSTDIATAGMRNAVIEFRRVK